MKRAGPLVTALGSAVLPAIAAAGGMLLLGGCASCQSTVQAVSVPAIAGATFDGAEIDQPGHRVYLANESDKSVTVVDVSRSTPRLAGAVQLDGPPKGLAFAPDRHVLYAGLATSGIAVIDPASMQVVSTIPLDGAAADLIDYSPTTGEIYAGSDGGVLVVNASSQQITRRLTTNSRVGQPRYDPTDSKLYVTTAATDSLVQLDPRTGYVSQTYVIPKCHPSGVGINPSRQLALVSCGSSIALVNLRSGAQQVTRSLQGGDVVAYDAAADRFVVASPHDRTDSAVGVFAGDGRFIGSVSSVSTAHAAVYDEAHGLVYAPGAAGLMTFAPGQCEPPPEWLQFAGGMSIFAVPFIAAVVFLVLYARRLRRGPTTPKGPTDRELREQDFAHEVERMRALEEGILGPEG